MNIKVLAEEMQKLRDQNDWSQEQLASESRVGQRAIQRIESGDANPTVDTIEALGKTLDFNPFELLEVNGVRGLMVDLETPRGVCAALKQLIGASPQRKAVVLFFLFQDKRYLLAHPELVPSFSKILPTVK